MSVNKYVRLARTIMDTLGLTAEEAVRNEAIPPEFKELVRAELESEVFEVRDLNFVEDRARDHQVWLPSADRNQWYYWPRLRSYLIDKKDVQLVQHVQLTMRQIKFLVKWKTH